MKRWKGVWRWIEEGMGEGIYKEDRCNCEKHNNNYKYNISTITRRTMNSMTSTDYISMWTFQSQLMWSRIKTASILEAAVLVSCQVKYIG